MTNVTDITGRMEDVIRFTTVYDRTHEEMLRIGAWASENQVYVLSFSIERPAAAPDYDYIAEFDWLSDPVDAEDIDIANMCADYFMSGLGSGKGMRTMRIDCPI